MEPHVDQLARLLKLDEDKTNTFKSSQITVKFNVLDYVSQVHCGDEVAIRITEADTHCRYGIYLGNGMVMDFGADTDRDPAVIKRSTWGSFCGRLNFSDIKHFEAIKVNWPPHLKRSAKDTCGFAEKIAKMAMEDRRSKYGNSTNLLHLATWCRINSFPDTSSVELRQVQDHLQSCWTKPSLDKLKELKLKAAMAAEKRVQGLNKSGIVRNLTESSKDIQAQIDLIVSHLTLPDLWSNVLRTSVVLCTMTAVLDSIAFADTWLSYNIADPLPDNNKIYYSTQEFKHAESQAVHSKIKDARCPNTKQTFSQIANTAKHASLFLGVDFSSQIDAPTPAALAFAKQMVGLVDEAIKAFSSKDHLHTNIGAVKDLLWCSC